MKASKLTQLMLIGVISAVLFVACARAGDTAPRRQHGRPSGQYRPARCQAIQSRHGDLGPDERPRLEL